MSPASPSQRGTRPMPALPTASAIRGTESSASDAWPMIPGIWSGRRPLPSSSPARRFRLPCARIVAVRSPTPARPANVSWSAPRSERVVDALAPDLRGRDAGGVHALGLGRGRPARRRSWPRPRSRPRSCRSVRSQTEPGLVEDARRAVAQVGVAGCPAPAPPSPRPPPSRGQDRRGRRSRAPGPARRRTRREAPPSARPAPCSASAPMRAADAVADRADRLRAALPRGRRGRRDRCRQARSRRRASR